MGGDVQTMSRKLLWVFLTVAGIAPWSGCGPKLQPEDLGEVLFDVSNEPRLNRYYPIKELPPPSRSAIPAA